MKDKPYAEVWLEIARGVTRCIWCGGTTKKMPRNGLCRPCNEVRKHLAKTEQWVKAERPTRNRHNQFLLDRELAIAKNMKQLCIGDGTGLRSILNGEVSPVDLEHWFTELARRIAKQPRKGSRLHYNIATSLGWSFSPAQRQLLAYLFWEVFHVNWQFNRRKRAQDMYSRDLTRSAEKTCS